MPFESGEFVVIVKGSGAGLIVNVYCLDPS
ncbi:protein of unknown function [Nitrospira japonica]|uniref:Uncharacterized protein n=1 Tax=Nitrospira japonica TaxID=1325564 RepID=A0A1W1I9N9_9BACT|nr:protein of unknown function [Nitrospira japonica]